MKRVDGSVVVDDDTQGLAARIVRERRDRLRILIEYETELTEEDPDRSSSRLNGFNAALHELNTLLGHMNRLEIYQRNHPE